MPVKDCTHEKEIMVPYPQKTSFQVTLGLIFKQTKFSSSWFRYPPSRRCFFRLSNHSFHERMILSTTSLSLLAHAAYFCPLYSGQVLRPSEKLNLPIYLRLTTDVIGSVKFSLDGKAKASYRIKFKLPSVHIEDSRLPTVSRHRLSVCATVNLRLHV